MFKYFFAILSFLSLTTFPAVMRMVIMEKEVAPDHFQRRILLGELHAAQEKDTVLQAKALTECMESFISTCKKACLCYEGASGKTLSLFRLLTELQNRSFYFENMLAAKISQNSELHDYLHLLDPREPLLALNTFMETVSNILLDRIENADSYSDVLVKLKNIYTVKDIINEYRKSIEIGIESCSFLKDFAQNSILKQVAASEAKGFNAEKDDLDKIIDRIPKNFLNSCITEIFASVLKKRINGKEMSQAEEAFLDMLSLLDSYSETQLFTDSLIELTAIRKMLETNSPEVTINLTGEIHNQNLIDILTAEGFRTLYDSRLYLKKNVFISRLFIGLKFSQEWNDHFPIIDDPDNLDPYIHMIDSDELKLMTVSREKLLEKKETATSHAKDEL